MSSSPLIKRFKTLRHPESLYMIMKTSEKKNKEKDPPINTLHEEKAKE